MKNCVYYELRKTIFTRKNIIAVAVLTFLFIGLLIWNGHSYISEKSARSQFFDTMGETVDDALMERLNDEEQKLYSRIFVTDGDEVVLDSDFASAMGQYGINNISEWSLVKEGIEIAESIRTRNNNISTVLRNPDNYAVDLYYEENNTLFADPKPLTVFVKKAYFGWFAVLICIIVLAGSYSVEKRCGMQPILALTPKGGTRLFFRKFVIGIVFPVVMTVFYAIVYMVVQFIILGINFADLGTPLFMVEGYEMCASGMTVAGLFGYMVMFVVAAAVAMSALTMLLSRIIGKGIFAGIASVALYVVGIAADVLYMGVYGREFVDNTQNWYLISAPTFYKIYNAEKNFNPLALLNAGHYFEEPQITRIAGGYYSTYLIPIIIVLTISFICYAILIKEGKNVKRI